MQVTLSEKASTPEEGLLSPSFRVTSRAETTVGFAIARPCDLQPGQIYRAADTITLAPSQGLTVIWKLCETDKTRTFLAQDSYNQKFVIKTFLDPKKSRTHIAREAQFQTEAAAIGVAPIVAWNTSATDGAIVMVYVPGRPLQSFMHVDAPLPEKVQLRIIEIYEQLAHIGIVHGNVKTSDIMIDIVSQTVHLSNFGLAGRRSARRRESLPLETLAILFQSQPSIAWARVPIIVEKIIVSADVRDGLKTVYVTTRPKTLAPFPVPAAIPRRVPMFTPPEVVAEYARTHMPTETSAKIEPSKILKETTVPIDALPKSADRITRSMLRAVQVITSA